MWEGKAMRDLIAANFRRMFKNNLFWGGILFMFFVAVVELVSSKIEALSGGGSAASSVLDSLLYDGALRLSVVMAVFVSVFVGTDYSDGTIRNKITLGHHRGSIFFANLIACVSAAVLMQATHLFSLFVPGWFLFRDLTVTTNEVISLILLDMLAVNAFTAIYVAVCMISRSKSTSAIVSLLFAFSASLLSLILFDSSSIDISLDMSVPKNLTSFMYFILSILAEVLLISKLLTAYIHCCQNNLISKKFSVIISVAFRKMHQFIKHRLQHISCWKTYTAF